MLRVCLTIYTRVSVGRVNIVIHRQSHNPGHNLLKHFRKTQHKLSRFMNARIACLPFPQRWFHAFAGHNVVQINILKGREGKPCKCFNSYDR